MTIPPGYADISVRLTNAAVQRPCYITFGVNPTETNPDTVAGIVSTSLGVAGGFHTKLDNNVSIGPVVARLGQDGGEALVGVSELVIAGTAVLASPPPNVALLVHKRTQRGGRRGRGRLFLPWFLGETDIDEGGTVLQATATSIQTALEVWRSDLATRSCPMVILHEPGVSNSGLPDNVSTLTVDRLVATQRRRLGR